MQRSNYLAQTTQLATKRPFSFPPHPTFVSALPGEKHNQRNITFLSDVI